MSKRYTLGLREILMFVIGVLAAVFLFSGCNAFIPGDKQAREEEKKIFGFLNGYNHRIKEAQAYLSKAGYEPGPVDGKMQRTTREAVKNFQRRNNLKPSGFIDKETWTHLSSQKNRDSSEMTPRKIKAALKKAGFYKGAIDDKMGEDVKAAILDFQKANGLKPDSVVGKRTWSKLSGFLE